MWLCDRLGGRKTFLVPALVVFSYVIDSTNFADFLSTDPAQDSDGLTDRGQQGRTQFTLPTFTVTSMSIDPTGPDEYQTSSAPVLEQATDNLTKIAGQKPVTTKAKTSVAGFRLREGNAIGTKVTLRGARMYEFLDRLVAVALPRIRDFRGINPNSFDGHGNYSLGISEQVIFPEIDADKIQHTLGMDITIVTSAKTDDHARELLTAFGMPFRQPGQRAGGK